MEFTELRLGLFDCRGGRSRTCPAPRGPRRDRRGLDLRGLRRRAAPPSPPRCSCCSGCRRRSRSCPPLPAMLPAAVTRVPASTSAAGISTAASRIGGARRGAAVVVGALRSRVVGDVFLLLASGALLLVVGRRGCWCRFLPTRRAPPPGSTARPWSSRSSPAPVCLWPARDGRRHPAGAAVHGRVRFHRAPGGRDVAGRRGRAHGARRWRRTGCSATSTGGSRPRSPRAWSPRRSWRARVGVKLPDRVVRPAFGAVVLLFSLCSSPLQLALIARHREHRVARARGGRSAGRADRGRGGCTRAASRRCARRAGLRPRPRRPAPRSPTRTGRRCARTRRRRRARRPSPWRRPSPARRARRRAASASVSAIAAGGCG